MDKEKVKSLWKKWKELSTRAASFQGRVILVILFFTVLAPVGLFFYFKKKSPVKTTWQKKDLSDVYDLESLKRQ